MRLEYIYRTTFRRKRRLQKCPQSRVMTNSLRTPKSPIFWDFAKGGPRETWPKSRPTWNTWEKLGANPMKSSFACAQRRIIGQLFSANGSSKSARKAKLWQIPQGHPNRPFSEILQRGDQGKLGQRDGLLNGLKKNWAQMPWNLY